MANIYQFSELELLAFFLVLVRLSAFVVSWPVFGSENIPPQIKVLFALILSLVTFPFVEYGNVTDGLSSLNIVFYVIREAFIGLSFGFLARMFFYAIHICGQILSISMGLSGAEVFDPSSGSRSSAVERTYIVVATLFFLAIHGHHLFLAGIVDSFRLVPLSAEMTNIEAFKGIGDVMMHVTIIGLKLAGPVMVSIFFMNVSMAIIGRAVPQINVLITSLPVNILVGFLVMIVSLPLVVWQLDGFLELTSHQLFRILKEY